MYSLFTRCILITNFHSLKLFRSYTVKNVMKFNVLLSYTI